MEFVLRKILKTNRAAAALIGVDEDTIGHWKNGHVAPNFYGMKDLAKAAGVSLDWLAHGDGFSPQDTRDFVFVPYRDFLPVGKASLSVCSGQELEDFSLRAEWIRTMLGMEPENLAMTVADTDSMEPTIHSGDILLLDLGVTAFAADAIYLFKRGDTHVLRRVQTLMDGTLLLKPDNAAYQEERLKGKEIGTVSVAGMVKMIGRIG